MTFQYLVGTPADRFNPTRDITKFVERVDTSDQLSRESEMRVTLNNPNGIFTDESRNDYIAAIEDYAFLIKYNSLNYYHGVITDTAPNAENSHQVDLVVRSDAEYLKRCIFSRAYSPEDYVYVEDVIEDMFKIASPRPSYYGLEYRPQHSYEDNFDSYAAGVMPPDWAEADANGDFLVEARPYNGTDPMYISEPNSVHLSCNASSQHQVYLDKLYMRGSKIIVSFRVYISSAIGSYQFQAILSDEAGTQLCYARMQKTGGNTNVYVSDGAVSRLIWGPGGPASNFFTFRFIVDLDTDTYAFYWGTGAAPLRYGANAGHTLCGAWSATYNNDMNLTNTGKVSLDKVALVLDDQSSAAQRDVWVDDVYVFEGDPMQRTPLSGEARFSATSIYAAITQLCSQYGLEWRDEPDPRRDDRVYLRTLRMDPDADAALTLNTTTNLIYSQAQRSATQFKNFFIVRGKDDILGFAADVDSIAQHGFFPLEKTDSEAESIPEVEEAAEALKNEHCRTPLSATILANGEILGYATALALRAGSNVTVTHTKAGLGSAQKYTITRVRCVIEGGVDLSIEVSDIWKSAALITYQALKEAKAAATEDPIDIMHLRYLAARVAVSGDWAFSGCTAAPSAVREAGITTFGRRAIREMQVSDIQNTNVDPYVERPAYYRLVDDQGAGYEGGIVQIDRWAISAVGTTLSSRATRLYDEPFEGPDGMDPEVYSDDITITTGGSSYAELDTAVAAEGASSLKIYYDGAVACDVQIFHTDVSGVFRYRFIVRATTNNTSNLWIEVREGAANKVQWVMNATGNIEIKYGNGVGGNNIINVPYSGGVDYELWMDIDTVNDVYRGWVDGVMYPGPNADADGFDNLLSDTTITAHIDELHLGQNAASNTFWVDGFQISSGFDKYCEIEFSQSAAHTTTSYFTWARTELVSKRILVLTETLGVNDSVLELDSTEDLRIHDKLVITNAAGSSVTVYVTEVMGSKVQIYGAHATEMPRGSVCAVYCNVIAAEDHTALNQAIANNISVQMTVRFTNEEVPTTQGQILTDGLVKFCQRLRVPGDIKTMNNNSGAAIVYTADTVNLNVGDYVNLLDTATGDNETRVILSINAGVSVTLTENLTYSYNAGDKITLVCFPWRYLASGVDETSRASNYYEGLKVLDKEINRVDGLGFAPSTTDKLKFSVGLGAGAFPPAMANTHLDGAHAAVSQLKVLSTKGMYTGQTVYIGSTLPLTIRTINSVDSATQITVSSAVTAADETPVSTGLRRDMDETETLYELALTDLPIDSTEGTIQYYLGKVGVVGHLVEMGHGDYQYDEYSNKDSQNSEYNRLGAGSPGNPSSFHSDVFSTAEYIIGASGIGAMFQPIRQAWQVRVEQSPLTYQKGRYPPLEMLLEQGTPIDPDLVENMDGDVAHTRAFGFNVRGRRQGRYRGRERIRASDGVSMSGIYNGLLFEVDMSGIVNRGYLHPDSLIVSLFGNGCSWDGTQWKSGLYVFVWLTGSREFAAGIIPTDQDQATLPHWELIPITDTAGADVDSTTLAPVLQMGTLAGGEITLNGNRVNQAMLDLKAYVLIIPRNPDDGKHQASFINLDYLTVGIDTTPLARDLVENTFRPGIDFLWAREWNFITWPTATPTGEVTTVLQTAYKGTTRVRVWSTAQLSLGDIIFVGTAPHMVTGIPTNQSILIDPPLRANATSGTSIKKARSDQGLDLWIDSQYYHSMTPRPATAIYSMSGQGAWSEVKNIVGTTVTLRSTEDFASSQVVMFVDVHTMQHKWTTISSITDDKNLVVAAAPGFRPTHMGLTEIDFDVAVSKFATPQQIIPSYEAIRAQSGLYNSWTPPNINNDVNRDYARAGLPGIVVDWIDETNGKLYLAVAMPHANFKDRSGGGVTVTAASTDGLDITIGGTTLSTNDWKRGYVKVTHAGIPQVRLVRFNYPTRIFVWKPFDPIPTPGDTVEFSVESGESFISGYDRFWCDNYVDWLVFYDTRIKVAAAGGANPTVNDISGDETIVTTADKIRPVRGSRFFVKNNAGSNDVIIKCGAVVDETNNAINNANLCLEEIVLPVAEFGFRLHAKYGSSWQTNTTTGLVRQCVDVVDAQSWANTTTLSSAAYIGQTIISVVANVFAVNDVILIHTVSGEEIAQVQSIAGAGPFQLTLYSPLRKAHANGTNVRKAYHKKVILDTQNPYGPIVDPVARVTVPFRYGAVYRVQYAVGRGKILARALLDPDDLATPVTLRKGESLKAAIEVAFSF